MVKKEFGEAGNTVLVEERLEGREVSVLALTDGRTIYILETCQDHKRLGDGDTGPNTGGMGVVCPGGLSTPPVPGGSSSEQDEDLLKQIEQEILVPTLDALRRDGIDYRGVLYAGLMLTPAGPKVLEYNCRFGDPECQALLVRMESDLIDVLMAVGARKLEDVEITWKKGASCCVVMASAGYPEKPKTGVPILGLEEAGKVAGVEVFQSGTKRGPEGKVVTAGGRALSVTAVGATAAEARTRAYEACGKIRFEGMQMRTDIGAVASGAGTKKEMGSGRAEFRGGAGGERKKKDVEVAAKE
jgi:phosphoribosylamine--glycine ligase